MWNFWCCLRAKLRFRGYKPRPVTFAGVSRWIKQFDRADRKTARTLLDKVIYLSEATTLQILVEQNRALMSRLAAAGLSARKLIYVQIHEAGSSSPVMLNLLRDAAGLERLGCRFVDSRDKIGINDLTNELGEGALIYVDDFVGSSNQFCGARDPAVSFVVGTFSEFLLVPSICEEAYYELGKRGVEAFAGHVHSKVERPLHDNSNVLDPKSKQRMRDLCKTVRAKGTGLGYKDLATMVVLYRNAPTSIPMIFRGSLNQTPFSGVFPRTTDLPIRK